MAFASILDPRNKTDCIDYYFGRIYNEGAELELERIRGILGDVLAEYQKTSVERDEHQHVGSSKLNLKVL